MLAASSFHSLVPSVMTCYSTVWSSAFMEIKATCWRRFYNVNQQLASLSTHLWSVSSLTLLWLILLPKHHQHYVKSSSAYLDTATSMAGFTFTPDLVVFDKHQADMVRHAISSTHCSACMAFFSLQVCGLYTSGATAEKALVPWQGLH